MSRTPGSSRQVAGLVVPVGELPELAQSAPPARYERAGPMVVVPVGELPELAQSAPPARYEGPGRKVIVGATG